MATKRIDTKEEAQKLKQASPAGMTYLVVTETVEEWKRNNPPEAIKQKALRVLETNTNEIVAKLLGFKQEYGGRWELDHCNGRSGNSPVGVLIAQLHKEAVDEWVKKVVMPTFSPKDLDSIQKGMKSDFDYQFKSRFRQLVLAHAEQEAQRAFDQLKVTGILNNMDELTKLIEQTD